MTSEDALELTRAVYEVAHQADSMGWMLFWIGLAIMCNAMLRK